MAHEGQELEGRDGFRLKLVRISDEVLEMEARYTGRGGLPPEHYHPRQDEHFEVLEGAVRAVVRGEDLRYERTSTSRRGRRIRWRATVPPACIGRSGRRCGWRSS